MKFSNTIVELYAFCYGDNSVEELDFIKKRFTEFGFEILDVRDSDEESGRDKPEKIIKMQPVFYNHVNWTTH